MKRARSIWIAAVLFEALALSACGGGSSSSSPCPNGEQDGGDGRCVKEGSCSPGHHDAGNGACANDTGPCRPGLIATGKTGHCCAEGYRDGGDRVCVREGSCSRGYEENPDGDCELPPEVPRAPIIEVPDYVTAETSYRARLKLPRWSSSYSWTIIGGTLESNTGESVEVRAGGQGAVTVTCTETDRAGVTGPAGTATSTIVPRPATPVITAPDLVTTGAPGNVASVEPQEGCTYFWSIAGGTATGDASGPSITFTALKSGPITLTCTVTNLAGDSEKGMKSVESAPPPPCPFSTGPTGGPAGWQELRSPNGKCVFYVPGSAAELPAPNRWGPCSFAGAPSGCEEIEGEGWTPLGGLGFVMMARDEAGKPLLSYYRWCEATSGVAAWIVGEVEGPVSNAMSEETGGDCVFHNASVGEGRFALTARVPRGERLGVLGGRIGELQPTFQRWAIDGSWRASSDWLVRWSPWSVDALSWDGVGLRSIFKTMNDPTGLLADSATMAFNGAIIVPVGGQNRSAVLSWTPTEGLRPLLRWSDSEGKGAANIGTDGETLVWTYGEGRPPGGDYRGYTRCYVQAAPFTADPEILAATTRTVAEEADCHLMNFPGSYFVGCGYAVRVGQSHAELIVVRLADGATWVFPRLPGTNAWSYAVGATCSAMYAVVGGTSTHVVRVPIESLGPPTR